MAKHKTKYFVVNIRGKPERIYWYPEFSEPGKKAVVLTRFAKLRIPFITSGNRKDDRKYLRHYLQDNGLTVADLPPDCEIHHNVFGDYLEWIPKDIHKAIHHIGAIGIYNRA